MRVGCCRWAPTLALCSISSALRPIQRSASIGLIEGASCRRRARGLAVHVERDAAAFLEYADDVRPLSQLELRGADGAELPAADRRLEAELPAIADAEKEAGGATALLLQDRRVVERIGSKRNPALDRERPAEARDVHRRHEHVRSDAVELQRVTRDAGLEPGIALDAVIE